MEHTTKDFLWGFPLERRGVHKVKLSIVCQPKMKGGLWLRHIKDNNVAFMAKVGWGLITKRDALWAKVVWSKYGYVNSVIP